MLFYIIRNRGYVDIFQIVSYILSTLFTIFLILPLHEWAHGFTANLLGDPTAKRNGRLTLNPLAHIDYMGAAMMIIIGFGWANPVPVDPRYFKKPKRDMALTALAGPLSNFLAAVVLCFLFYLIQFVTLKINPTYNFQIGFLQYILYFLYYAGIINTGLAVFNMIPIPPLDGSKILMAFLPDSAIMYIHRYGQHIQIVFFALILLISMNGNLIVHAQIGLYSGIDWVIKNLFGMG